MNPSHSSNSSLHPYMVHSGDPREGACLVIARTAKHARSLGAPVVQSWHGCNWIDIRVKRLRDHESYLMSLARQDGPHVIAVPPTCETCEFQGTVAKDAVARRAAGGYVHAIDGFCDMSATSCRATIKVPS